MYSTAWQGSASAPPAGWRPREASAPEGINPRPPGQRIGGKTRLVMHVDCHTETMRTETATSDTVAESEPSADAGERAQGTAPSSGRDRELSAPRSPAAVRAAEFEQLKARLRHLVGTNNFR